MFSTSFEVWDYVVFGLTLAVSISIGIYYAVHIKNQSTSEYLVASHSMTFLPVALSIIATFQSSVMMLGTPAEGYMYGISWVLAELGTFTGQILEVMLSLVFLRRLDLSTPFEYFERRYQSRGLRISANLMCSINYLLYISVVLYGQGMALQAVTGFSIYGSIILTASTTIIYTSIGGLRAVIWTDVLQLVIMFTGLLVVTIKGTLDAGGVVEVWNRASQSGRLDISLDPDPTVRHTVWNLFFGRVLTGFGFLISPPTLQRISSTKSLKESNRSFVITIPGYSLMPCIATVEGIVAYAYYSFKRCDPLVSKQIDNPNQIIPFLMMDLFRNLPGMPGLFMASLSCASLSTISSCLSATANIALHDIFKTCKPNMSESRQLVLVKCTVVLFGVIGCIVAIILSLTASQTLNQIVYTFESTRHSVTGLFYVGALFPFVNAKGAMTGFFTGIVLLFWLMFGSMLSASGHSAPHCTLGPTDQCPHLNLTTSILNVTTLAPSSPNYANATQSGYNITTTGSALDTFYSLSYILFSPLAISAVVLIGAVASLVTGGWKNRADPELVIQMDDIQFLCNSWKRKRYVIANSDQTDIKLTDGEQMLLTTNDSKQQVPRIAKRCQQECEDL